MEKKKTVLLLMLLAIMLLTACVANVPDAPAPLKRLCRRSRTRIPLSKLNRTGMSLICMDR